MHFANFVSRLVNGITHQNRRSARFHEKLGYRVTKNLLDEDYTAILENRTGTGNQSLP